MRNYISPNEISFGDVDDLKKISEIIRLDEPYNKGGLPLYSNTSEMLVSTSDTHSLILGTTGYRKTRSVVFPMVLNIASAKEKQSMIVTIQRVMFLNILMIILKNRDMMSMC